MKSRKKVLAQRHIRSIPMYNNSGRVPHFDPITGFPIIQPSVNDWKRRGVIVWDSYKYGTYQRKFHGELPNR